MIRRRIQRKIPSRALLITALIGLLFATAATVVYAAGDSEVEVIQACVGRWSGRVRIVGSADDCRRVETPLDWNVQGPQGEPGPQGEQGEPGPSGADGADGTDGLSCWDVYGDTNGDGNINADDCVGPQGPQGDPGPPGADGVDGAPGADGVDGADGADGVDGQSCWDVVGDTNGDGVANADDCIGPQGPQGEPGPQGDQGPPGATLWSDDGSDVITTNSAVEINRYGEALTVLGEVNSHPVAGMWSYSGASSTYLTWDDEELNTDPGSFSWTAGSDRIEILKNGYYLISFIARGALPLECCVGVTLRVVKTVPSSPDDLDFQILFMSETGFGTTNVSGTVVEIVQGGHSIRIKDETGYITDATLTIYKLN